MRKQNISPSRRREIQQKLEIVGQYFGQEIVEPLIQRKNTDEELISLWIAVCIHKDRYSKETYSKTLELKFVTAERIGGARLLPTVKSLAKDCLYAVEAIGEVSSDYYYAD